VRAETISRLACVIAAAVGMLAAAIWSGGALAQSSAVEPPGEVEERVGCILGLVRDGLWGESDRFWHEGEYRRCIALARMITEIDPQDTEAFSTGAWLLWNVGEGEEAIAFYKKGISANPSDPDLYFDLGMHYYNLGRYVDAIAVMEAGAALNPPPIKLRLLAHAYERAGRREDSIRTWERMKALTPDDPVVDRNLERVKKCFLGEDRWLN